MNNDSDQLRLLSVFHYVYAGLVVLFACFPLIYVVIGISMAAGAFGKSQSGSEPPIWMGGLFAVIGVVAFVFIFVMAALTAYAGKCLADRRHYTFCIVVSAINCLSFPFGTALGVFTIVILQRPGVRAMFGQDLTPKT